MKRTRQRAASQSRKGRTANTPSRPVYNLATTAQIAGISTQSILVYWRMGLVRPAREGREQEPQFNDEGVHTLRRIEYLRTQHGVNLAGLRIIFELMKEVRQLRSEIRFWRDN